jgi:hypothetical protein
MMLRKKVPELRYNLKDFKHSIGDSRLIIDIEWRKKRKEKDDIKNHSYR